ncbi:MAG: ATP-binding protein [Spirochaetales bacterium]|nr:ATP-binding protein [Spirochaetales bacterium]
MSKKTTERGGKLKIGDDWNAITIIALSQNNPLKAIAEFVENSIDANAKHISLIRGKEKGEVYLRVVDDGDGIEDLKYVATHIGDSIKRNMKKAGGTGIQGEFGIGLLSFWTVGKELVITTSCKDGKPRRMKMVRENPGYSISQVNHLFDIAGTELLISPILPGIRALSGERLQAYLASELRDRIAKHGVRITIYDKLSRKQLEVEPRKFHGHLLHNLPEIRSPYGEIYCELYLNEPSPDNELGLYKLGTRVFPKITVLDCFSRHPWNSPYLEGIIDCSFLQLTPGTRDGVVQDDMFSAFIDSMQPMEEYLDACIREQKQAEEQKASKTLLSRLTKAFRDAYVYLADLDYSWLEIKTKKKQTMTGHDGSELQEAVSNDDLSVEGQFVRQEADTKSDGQKVFFEYPGPLKKVVIVPAKCILPVNGKKKLRAVCRDQKGTEIDHGIGFIWKIVEGHGTLEDEGMYAEYQAGEHPEAVLLSVEVYDGKNTCSAECVITVTAELIDKKSESIGGGKGLPGYTYRKAPGELWRSRYDREQNLIIINNGHQDFIYASKLRVRQLKYIARLFAKEMILANFPGIKPEESLERMSELLLYIEENL